MFGQLDHIFDLNTIHNNPFGQNAFRYSTITSTDSTSGTAPGFKSNPSFFNSNRTGSSVDLFGNMPRTSNFGQSVTAPSFRGFGTTDNQFSIQQYMNNLNNFFGIIANKQSGFGFGVPSNFINFGNPQQSTPFDQINISPSTGFEIANPMSQMTGTVVKFNPVIGTDTITRNGTTQTVFTRYHCITCMREYEMKSLEELRLEDYTFGRAGRKNQTRLFGVSNQSFASPNMNVITAGNFGTTQFANFGNEPINFGLPTINAFTLNPGNSTGLFVQNNQKPFGMTQGFFSTSANNNIVRNDFGGNLNSGFWNSQNTGFGLSNRNKSNFVSPAFSTVTGFGPVGNMNLFGTKSVTPFITMNTPFGTTNTPSGTTNTPFGTTNTPFGTTNTPFGTTNTLFGKTNTPFGTMNTFSGPTANQTTRFPFGIGNKTGFGFNTGLNLNTSNFFSNEPKPQFGSGTGAFGIPQSGSNTSNSLQTNPNSITMSQQIQALVSNPFGDSPLLKNLPPAPDKTRELLKSISPISKTIKSSQYRISTQNPPKIKSRVFNSSQKSLFNDLEENLPLMEAFQPRPSAKRLVIRPKTVTNIMENDDFPRIETCRIDGDSLSTDKENQECSDNHKSSTSGL